jgi:phospholipase/carboxylesterase
MTGRLDLLANRLRPAAGEPEGALVLFHGRGTSEHDLFPLFDLLDPEGRLAGAAPRGPLSFPPGGAHWYGPVRRVGYPNEETFNAGLARVAEWLAALHAELGVPIERTVLGGFSQGAVMAYALGLGRDRPAPAGIIALSGFVPRAEGFELDLEHRAGLPVAIGHGSLDPIIGVEWGREARELLERAGAAVSYREAPLPHTVDPAFLGDLRGWLRDVLPG